jgi:hypothetical protein
MEFCVYEIRGSIKLRFREESAPYERRLRKMGIPFEMDAAKVRTFSESRIAEIRRWEEATSTQVQVFRKPDAGKIGVIIFEFRINSNSELSCLRPVWEVEHTETSACLILVLEIAKACLAHPRVARTRIGISSQHCETNGRVVSGRPDLVPYSKKRHFQQG